MSVSSVGGVHPQHLKQIVAQPAAAKTNAMKDVDGDHDGTTPGKIDVRDVLAGKVNLRL